MAIAPSFDELEQLGRAEQILNRPDLQVNEGDISEMLIKAAAAMADKCVEHSASSFRETFLDGATGQALTDLVNDHWNLPRLLASAATGSVAFTRVSATGPAGSIPAGTVVATVINPEGEDFRFETDTALAFALDEQGPKSVGVTAQATGRESNVNATGLVTRIVDALFDSFTVTNDTLIVGGAPEEEDPDYRQRAREYPSTLRRGTLAALEFGAKQITGVKIASAFEDAFGLVTVYVSDIDGNSSAQMINDVQVELDTNWKAGGTVLTVAGGVPVLTDIDYSLTVRPGTDVAALEPSIAAAITGTMKKLKQGETLSLEQVATAIMNVDIDNITKVTINDPLADIDPPDNQVIRAGTITRS